MKKLNDAILHGWACIALLFILGIAQFTDEFPNDYLYYIAFNAIWIIIFFVFTNYQKIMIDNERYLRKNLEKYESLCNNYLGDKDQKLLNDMLFEFDLEGSINEFETAKQNIKIL